MTRREELRERARIGREKALARFRKAGDVDYLHKMITVAAIDFVNEKCSFDVLRDAVREHATALAEYREMCKEITG